MTSCLPKATLGSRTAIGLILCAGSAGCSNFDRDFEVAIAHGGYSQGFSDFTGPWEGTWESEVDGHSGRLRCLIEQTGAEEFRGRFQAIYLGVFPFEHELRMKAVLQNGVATFTGLTQLMFHGEYQWTGQIVGDEFTAEYKSKRDHGTFKMTRSGRPLPADTGIRKRVRPYPAFVDRPLLALNQ